MFNWSGYYFWKAKWINCNPRRTILVWTLLSTIVCDVLNFTKQNKTQYYFRNTSCDCFQFVTFKKFVSRVNVIQVAFCFYQHGASFRADYSLLDRPHRVWHRWVHTRTSFNVCKLCLNTLPTHRRIRSKHFRNLTRIEIFKPLLWRFLFFLYFYGTPYLLSLD